jgi:hypothetical protein
MKLRRGLIWLAAFYFIALSSVKPFDLPHRHQNVRALLESCPSIGLIESASGIAHLRFDYARPDFTGSADYDGGGFTLS